MIKTITINDEHYMCIMCQKEIENKIKDKLKGKIKEQYKDKFYVPTEGTIWSSKRFFIEKLELLEQFLIEHEYMITIKNSQDCILCKTKNISHYIFKYKGVLWSDEISHYINVHNVKPPSKFIKFVLNNDPTNSSKCSNSSININGKHKKLNKFSYVKIKSNQLLILDALMEHGGVMQRYKEKHETGYKYSEHAGMLEFDGDRLDRVIISGSTERTKNVDPEIFFPTMGDAAYKYEYIFHTHPATPTPGGRAIYGILYEMPSTNDIYHFIEHSNHGKVQGSLVLTPEGLYNIRKYYFEKHRIETPSKNFISGFRSTYHQLQRDAINKFGVKFIPEYFYKTIAQDTAFVDGCNEFLHKYDLHFDYYPRQKTKTGNWILGTIYLPICTGKK